MPNRLSVSLRVAMNAPTAIRIVAGTRLWSRPASSARDRARQRGDEVDRIATGAISRLNRNWSPGWFGSSE